MASQLEAAGTATMIDDDAAHVSVHDDAKAEEPLRGAVHDIVVADGHSSGSDDNDDYYAEYDEYSDHDNSHRGRHPGDDVEAQRGVPHLVTLPSATTTSLAGDRLAQGDLSDESLLDDLQSALDIVGVDLSASEVLVEFTERFGSSDVAMQRLKEFCRADLDGAADDGAPGDALDAAAEAAGEQRPDLSLIHI